MVLESVVSSVLNQVLSAYVENFNPKQLNVGIWGGDIKLKKLKLKKGALDKFRLPVDVLDGSVGSLVVTVPWTALGSRPVKAVFEDIYLLAVPASQTKFDPKEDEKRKQASKMEKLKNSELLLSPSAAGISSGANEEETSKNESFVVAMTNKILDNLQLMIRNVHIRYEDKLSVPGHPFSIGFTLAELSAVSTDENWQESFVVGPKSGVHKLTTLNSLALYFNTDSRSLANLEAQEFQKQFTQLIARAKDVSSDNNLELPHHQYVLKPVSGQGKLIMRKQPTKELARIDCELMFSELAFLVDADQYRDVLSCLDLFHFYTRHREFIQFRPSDEAFAMNKARALWAFALAAAKHEVHQKAHKWSWACLLQRKKDREAYVALFKAEKLGNLSSESRAELQGLEHRLSYQDIRFYRSLARSEMRKEKITAKMQEETSSAPANSGWLGWIWPSGSQPTAESGDRNQPEGVLGEEERKQLYEAIEWDEREAVSSAIDLPRDAMLFNVQTELKTGSFTLRTAKQSSNSGEGVAADLPHDIISLVFDGFSANVIQRTDNSELSLSLAGFRVSDGTVKDTQHCQIVRVKDIDQTMSSALPSETSRAISQAQSPSDVVQPSEKSPFLFFKFEHKPLDGRADNALLIKMRHLEIVYHPGYVEGVFAFFQPPASQLESVGAFIDVASETLEGIRQDTRAGLEFALQSHKTVDIKVDMNAPVIIIPQDVTRYDCQHIILYAGHMSVSSELVPEENFKAIQPKQHQHYTDDDYARLESMMYDKFHVSLKDTQIILGKSFQQCKSALDACQETNDAHLLERISMHFDVFNCIVDNAPRLSRFKVQGSLPQLRINFSDRKYKIFMSMIDVALPNLNSRREFRDPLGAVVQDQGTKGSNEDNRVIQNKRRSAFGVSPFAFEDNSLSIELGDDEDSKNFPSSDPEVKDDDVFYEAPHLMPVENPVNFTQKKLELCFTVGKLIISLSKSDSGDGDDQRLVDSVLEGFYLGFNLKNFDMAADITLSSMYIEDCLVGKNVNASPVFKKLVTSDNVEDLTNEKSYLVKFNYSQVQKEHPEFMTVYEGISKAVDADLSTINVAVTRPTILELLDWILNTFAEPSVPKNSARDLLREPNDATSQSTSIPPPANNEKLRVKVKLRTISFLLNEDGIRLATLSLSSADLSVLLNGPTLRVHARLGNLTLSDDTESSENSQFRQLVNIQGDNLADFQYETFVQGDPTYPGHDSMVYLRSRSIQFTIVDEIWHRILIFLSQFAQMKAVMDAARKVALQQANDLTDMESKMHYNLLIETPIIMFPLHPNSRDCLIAHLGQISASNSFVEPSTRFETKTGSAGNGSAIKTEAGIHNIRLTSEFYSDNKCNTLLLLGDVNIDVIIAQFTGRNRLVESPQAPDTDVVARMSDVRINLTQPQYSALVELAASVPKIFDFKELKQAPISNPQTLMKETQLSSHVVACPDLKPELSTRGRTESGTDLPLWTTTEVSFNIENITLELFDAVEVNVNTMKSSSLAKFSLNGTRLHWRTQCDGSMAAELSLKALRAIDTRPDKATKFREIVPVAGHGGDQLVLSYNQTRTQSNIILELDSPNVILSLDYISSISAFFSSSDSPNSLDGVDPLATTEAIPQELHPGLQKTQPESTLSYRLNIIQPRLTIVSDLEREDSDAVLLIVENIGISHQETLAVTISNLGMSLASMDDRDGGVSFLDKCILVFSIDQRSCQGAPQMSIQVHTSPVVLKLSYRDFLVVYSVYSKALNFSQEPSKKPALSPGEQSRSPLRTESYPPSLASHQKAINHSFPMKVEQLSIRVDKLQIVCIGDLHELPMLDLNTSEFLVSASDWSGQFALETSIVFSVNYFNLTNSHWEPLMELWPTHFDISRKDACTALTLESKKRLELNVTATFMDIIMTNLDIWGREGENVLRKKRGMTAPYMIKNLTGYRIMVWAESEDDSDSGMKQNLEDGAELPWRFEDWKVLREHVSSSNQDTLGVVLQNTGWKSVSGISVVREGDEVYPLYPQRERVTHRLLCHVEIQKNVKVVTFRSTFQVQNDTMLCIEMCVVNPKGDELHGPYQIVPGQSCSVPIEAAFHQRIKIRPDPGFGYGWCEELLNWKDLVQQPVRTIVCHSINEQDPPHRFIAATIYDKEDSTVQYYPKITLRLRAPIEIENLLPHDILYRVHRKGTPTYSAFLRQGGISPVHIVDPMDLLLLAIEFLEEGFSGTTVPRSNYAVVNTDNPEDVPIENRLPFYDGDESVLNLGLHYLRYPLSGGAFKVQIYCPYVVINKTGLEFAIRSKPLIGSARNVAGQNLHGNSVRRKEPRPFLFSHGNEYKRNRVILRIGDSNWSNPISFDVVGANQQVTMSNPTKTSEYWVGLSVSEGLGKYKLTKVVTIYPRFIIKNHSQFSLCLREHSSDQQSVVRPGKRMLLSLFRNSADPQLVLSYDTPRDKKWSRPFRIQDVGKVYIRVSDSNGVESLVHVEVLLQGPSIFIKLDVNTQKWPFLIRNKSSSDFLFGQTWVECASRKMFGTARLYQSPPNSEIPYAWDEPSVGPESLIRVVLCPSSDSGTSQGKPTPGILFRDVHVLEVGQLKPLRTQKKGHKLAFDVVAEGQAQVVVISDYNEATNIWKVAEREESSGQIQRSDTYSSLGDAGFEAANVTPVARVTISISLEGVGVSIIDARLRELLYASLQGIEVTYLESQLHQEYQAIIRWIQLDNQLDGALFPVLLRPVDLPNDHKELENRPNLQVKAEVVKDDKHGVVYIKYATVLMQKMSLEMDESFIIALLGFSKNSGMAWQRESTNQLTLEPESIPEPDSEGGGLDLYFELLHLQPLVVIISFERQDSVDVTERTFDSRNPLYFLLNAVTMAIGTISGAPLTFNQLKVESARMTQGQLMTRLIQHYQAAGLSQLYRVLASADFLGNPAGLFQNVSSGVQDLFYEPFQGVVLHGDSLGVGIARGAASLVKKSAFGVTDSVSKIAGSVGKGLSAATLDSSWALKRQRRQFRNRNKINGLATGANAFFDSLASGVQGVALKPIQGAESGGAAGFFKGLGKGLVGVVAKPAVGTFDFLSNVSGGLRNATTIFDPSRGGRYRLPRHIAVDGVLRPYNAREAQGRDWLKSIDNGKFYSSMYVAHVELPNDEDSVCILTTNHVLMVRINKLTTSWQVPLAEIAEIQAGEDGIKFKLNNARRGPLVALTDSSLQSWFSQHLTRMLKDVQLKRKRAAGGGLL